MNRSPESEAVTWRFGVHMCKEHLRLNAKLGPPQSSAALQGTQHAGVPPIKVAALAFFEQGDGVEPNIGL